MSNRPVCRGFSRRLALRSLALDRPHLDWRFLGPPSDAYAVFNTGRLTNPPSNVNVSYRFYRGATQMPELPTVEQLRAELSYAPDTGAITRLRSRKPVYVERRRSGPRIEVFGRLLPARWAVLNLYFGRPPRKGEFHTRDGYDVNDLRIASFQRRFTEAGVRLCRDCEGEVEPDRQHLTGSAGARCRSCFSGARKTYSRRSLLHQYGLTEGCYSSMVTAQGGKCKICARPASEERYGLLSVDHCHTTGAVRGLLCTRCNTSIGGFGDDPAVVLRAAKYLLGKG